METIGKYTKQDFRKVHDAIHTGKLSVEVQGTQHKIMKRTNGCRSVKLHEGPMVMEQNKNKTSKYSEKARNGEKICWIMKGPSWGYIDDKTIRL